jgi:2-polyprenyl-3-methyl-5-hydroxy-6-metoxy-1,4-benzoquinol methylase
VRLCYFCAGQVLLPFVEATYWGEYPLHFVECARCRLVFANPMPALETIIAGNRALSIHHRSRGTLSQYRGGKEFARELTAFRATGILLDIGCAEGFFLLGVRESCAWQVEGLEIIESSVAFARHRLGLVVHAGPLERLNAMDGRFDYIRMNNVLEHVQDPIRFLRRVNALLRPGGRTYCSTPNGFQEGCLFRTANRRGLQLNLLENHLFCYRPRTLRAIFAACGFRVLASYCEDISHTLNDLGLLPWFRYPQGTQQLRLSDFAGRPAPELDVSDEEIQSYGAHPSLRAWRMALRRLSKTVLRPRFPSSLPLGHQQHIHAEKL